MIIRLDGDLAGEFATARRRSTGFRSARPDRGKLIRSLLSKVPLKLNVNITGPFRALIADGQVVQRPAPGDRAGAPAAARSMSRDHHRGPPSSRKTSNRPRRPTTRSGQRRPATQAEVRSDMRPAFKPSSARRRAAGRAARRAAFRSRRPTSRSRSTSTSTIKQEVLVRLQRDVEQLINQNPQAFPRRREEAVMSTFWPWPLAGRRPRPAAAQTPAVECGARGRQHRRALRRLSRGRRAGRSGGSQPGRDDQHPAPRALQQPRRAARACSPQDVGITAGCELLARVSASARPTCERRRVAATRGGAGRAVPDYCR